MSNINGKHTHTERERHTHVLTHQMLTMTLKHVVFGTCELIDTERFHSRTIFSNSDGK